MPRIVWTDNATACMQRLYDFLKDKNPDAATNAVDTIHKRVCELEVNPSIGKPVEYLDAQFRTYNVSFGKRGYVVLYRHEGDTVFIISVKHYLELEFIV